MAEKRSFLTLLKNRWQQKKYVCVGLDPVYSKLPSHLTENLSVLDAFIEFNKQIIDVTHSFALAYKPQIAYYSAEGEKGMRALYQTITYVKNTYPDIPLILDAKRGDIGSTAEAYTKEVFDILGVDAVTLNPYLGFDALEPFLKRKEKGIIILCRTSNPGASDFQDLLVDNKPLFIHVAEKVKNWNEQYGNCLLVVGATWPKQMKTIRDIVPDMWFLIPGIGSQGGDLDAVLANGLSSDKSGIIISASRSIIFASPKKDFGEKAGAAAKQLNEQIAKHL